MSNSQYFFLDGASPGTSSGNLALADHSNKNSPITQPVAKSSQDVLRLLEPSKQKGSLLTNIPKTNPSTFGGGKPVENLSSTNEVIR